MHTHRHIYVCVHSCVHSYVHTYLYTNVFCKEIAILMFTMQHAFYVHVLCLKMTDSVWHNLMKAV